MARMHLGLDLYSLPGQRIVEQVPAVAVAPGATALPKS
jgi:hypothetical protein